MPYLARLLVAMLFISAGAHASTILTATLTNDQENPPVVPTTASGDPRPMSSGFATFVINDDMTSMSFEVLVNNIDLTGLQTVDTNDNLTAAHIHASATSFPGTNAGAVFGFIGMPFNDVNPTDVVVTPFASGVGGTVSAKWDLNEGNNTSLLAQLPNILGGTAYINFHTVQFGGGEIRGQIVPIPEPETYALMLAGIGLIVLARRQRRG